MSENFVNTVIYGIAKSGEKFPIHIEIGKPYHRMKHGEHDWACPLSLKPLYQNLAEASGVDALHALCLGLSLVFDLLSHFCIEGGKLEYDDGTEFQLDGYSFGQALRSRKNAT